MEWLRLYVSTLDNPKVQALPGGMFKAWVNCLCLARINDGFLPPVDAIAFRLRCSARQAEQWRNDLVQRELVDLMPDGAYRMHDWERYRSHFGRLNGTGAEAPRETARGRFAKRFSNAPDTEQNRNRFRNRIRTGNAARRSAFDSITGA